MAVNTNYSRWNAEHVIIGAVVMLFVAIIGGSIWYHNWVHFVENYQLGFTYDKMTGKLELLDHTGWVIRTPWRVSVHHIDLRPGQVCMNANARVLNCKLVQFNPQGLKTFVEWHGRSAGDNGDVYEILKSYAFNVNEGRDCPFLTILDDMRPKATMPSSVPAAIPAAQPAQDMRKAK